MEDISYSRVKETKVYLNYFSPLILSDVGLLGKRRNLLFIDLGNEIIFKLHLTSNSKQCGTIG